MDRVRNSRKLHMVFDALLGVVSLALAMIFSAVLDWPVNALIGIIIVSGTVLMIVQNRKSFTIDDEDEQEA